MSNTEEILCKLFDIRDWIPEFSIGKSIFFFRLLINRQVDKLSQKRTTF